MKKKLSKGDFMEAGAEVLKYSGEEFKTMEHSGVIVGNKDVVKEILETIRGE